MSLLEIKNLTIEFETLRGPIRPVEGLSLCLNEGETIGIVGESGSGKSLTSLAVMGLLPENAKICADVLSFEGQDLLKISESERRKLRGGAMARIFQDPMTSLNPSFTVGFQIIEALRVHQRGTRAELKRRACELLEQVGIPDPESRLDAYSFQLSGGMSQRVMIAIAIAGKPRLLIADEPTTALDVTIQAQILRLLKELQKDFGMALMLITHNIGVVAQMADHLTVAYAGEIVEDGSIRKILENPRHPYTKGLLDCLPEMHDETEHRQKLASIPGLVPDLLQRPLGCQFSPRCSQKQSDCDSKRIPMIESNERKFRCLHPFVEVQR